MEGAAFLPRWQGVGASAAGSLVAAGSLAAASPQRRGAPAAVPTTRGWPKGLRPIFLDEIPPRLEDVKEKIAAVDRDLGRLCGDKMAESGASTVPANSPSAPGEPESEASPSSRRNGTAHGERHGADQEPDPLADEDLAVCLSRAEAELVALHKKWKVVDEDRHNNERERDALAAKVRASEGRVESFCNEVAAMNGRLLELDQERQALRSDLGVSEVDVEALRPLAEEAQRNLDAKASESHELHARLYAAQHEVEDLRNRVEAEEQERAAIEEHQRLLEAEREERRLAVERAMDTVREQLEAEMAEERREADRQERELKLALAELAQRQQATEESIKRVTGNGIPEPPRWFRSAMPALLTRRKRFAHGLMPAGASPFAAGESAEPEVAQGEAADAEPAKEEQRSPARASPDGASQEGAIASVDAELAPGAEQAEGEEAPAEKGGEDAEDDGSFDLDPEALAMLEAMAGEGMRTAAPELVLAAGLPAADGNASTGSTFVPASCTVDLIEKSLCLQVLEPSGSVRKISLVEIGTISRPEELQGIVDVAVTGDARGELVAKPAVKQRLRISTTDEDSASALVAAISHPDRVLPGSALISGRTSSRSQADTQVDTAK